MTHGCARLSLKPKHTHWIKRFIYFSGKRHPGEMGAPEVTAFLNHLAHEREVAAATQNQNTPRMPGCSDGMTDVDGCSVRQTLTDQ